MLWKMESVFLSQLVGVLLCFVRVHTCLLCVCSMYQDQPFSAMSLSLLYLFLHHQFWRQGSGLPAASIPAPAHHGQPEIEPLALDPGLHASVANSVR